MSVQQNTGRISSEGVDVALDPLQCSDLIHQGIVARGAMFVLCSKGGMSQESERPQPVVHGHGYNRAPFR